MIVYVAAASKEIERARRAMDAVKAAGHTVAHDWAGEIDRWHGESNVGIPKGAARTLSLLAFQHVRRAGLLWLLFPQEETIGAWIETGGYLFKASTEVGARSIVSGGDPRCSIFLNGLVDRYFENDAAAARWLENPVR